MDISVTTVLRPIGEAAAAPEFDQESPGTGQRRFSAHSIQRFLVARRSVRMRSFRRLGLAVRPS